MRRVDLAFFAGALLGLLVGWWLFSGSEPGPSQVALQPEPPDMGTGTPPGKWLGWPALAQEGQALRRPELRLPPASGTPTGSGETAAQQEEAQPLAAEPTEGTARPPYEEQGAGLPPPPPAQPSGGVLLSHPRLAYLDTQRALQVCEEGRAAKARLKGEHDGQQRRLDEAQEGLKRDQAALVRQERDGALPPGELTARRSALEQRSAELTQEFKDAQARLSAEEKRLTREIFDKMAAVAREIAQADGYLLVFDKTESGLLFAEGALDITSEVVRRLDARAAAGPPP